MGYRFLLYLRERGAATTGDRDVRRLFLTQFVSLVGTGMQGLALSWLVYRLTGSPAALGLIAVARWLPLCVLVPLGGVVADRFERRHVVLAAQFVAGLVSALLAVLTLTSVVRPWHAAGIAVALAVTDSFDIPARQAFVTERVAPGQVTAALGLNAALTNAARLVSAPVAGLLVARVGEGWCFVLNALSFVPVTAAVGTARRVITSRGGGHAPAPPGTVVTAARASLAEGLRFAVGTPAVAWLLALTMCVGLAAGPVMTLLPVYVRDVLHGTARTMGWLLGAAGLGALLGSALLTIQPATMAGLKVLTGGGAVALGMGLAAAAATQDARLALIVFLALGFAAMVQVGAANAALVAVTPDSLRGRIAALTWMLPTAATPLGAVALSGVTAHGGFARALLLGAAVCVPAGTAFLLRAHSSRHAARAEPPLSRSEAPPKAVGPADPPHLTLTGTRS